MGALSPKSLLKTCFIVAALIVLIAPEGRSEADGPDYFKVQGLSADQNLEIRSDPDEQAAIVGEIAGDTDGLLNLGCEGGLSLDEWLQMNEDERDRAADLRWCKVSYGEVEGWVPGRSVSEGSEPTLDETQKP